MSRFKKLAHVIWHGQYHIVWVPKFRYRVLKGPVAEEVYTLYPGALWAIGLRGRLAEYPT